MQNGDEISKESTGTAATLVALQAIGNNCTMRGALVSYLLASCISAWVGAPA